MCGFVHNNYPVCVDTQKVKHLDWPVCLLQSNCRITLSCVLLLICVSISTAQQHSYAQPQDTNSYGVANPSSYPTDAAYNSATGYGYTDQTSSYHYDQSTGVASTAGYPRTAQTQQRGTATGAYNSFGAAR